MSGPVQIYTNNRPFSPADKATQIRHLALIGIAASDTNMNVKGLDSAFESLFEVMVLLADEIERELES